MQEMRDCGFDPGSGRSPGEGNGYPLQYYGLENSMDCLVHGVDGVGDLNPTPFRSAEGNGGHRPEKLPEATGTS